MLVVEDDEITLCAVQGVLTTAGFDVEVARDGREALARLREGKIRLVVSDWEMPHLSGVALCRKIRSESQPGYVYIILLTANSSIEERVAGLSVGADDYIVKPFHGDELVARVRIGVRILSMFCEQGESAA